MRLQKLILLVLSALLAFSAVSCGRSKTALDSGPLSSAFTASAPQAAALSTARESDTQRSSTITEYKSAATPVSAAPPASIFPIDVRSQAKKLGSTPGRVALAAIIIRLDNASPIEDLSRNSAKELFDVLRQTASQKSQTLEALDQLYGLSDILASENIYVRFQANNVVSAADESGAASSDWIDRFQKAINAASSD